MVHGDADPLVHVLVVQDVVTMAEEGQTAATLLKFKFISRNFIEDTSNFI